ncbi:MAG: Pr6Pr family membrane protein [Rhizomicrobium sp.]
MRNRLTLFVAIAGMALGWSALLLQLALTLTTIAAQGGTVPGGLWRYFGYFTVIANIFASIILTCAVLRRKQQRGEFAAVTTMILVGVVYSLLLRETWDPRGWQKVADVALHDAMPLIVTLFWLLRPHGGVRGGAIAASLVLPLGYCAYAMARGFLDGWYPYLFLDAARLGAARVTLNCLGIGLAFLGLALLLAGLDRALARRGAPLRA